MLSISGVKRRLHRSIATCKIHGIIFAMSWAAVVQSEAELETSSSKKLNCSSAHVTGILLYIRRCVERVVY